MKQYNVRKIFLMIVDAVIVALATLVSNALLSVYGIVVHHDTYSAAVQPIRVFGIMGLNVLFPAVHRGRV